MLSSLRFEAKAGHVKALLGWDNGVSLMQKVAGMRLEKGFRRCSRGFLHMVKLSTSQGLAILSLPILFLHQDYPLLTETKFVSI